MVWPWGCSRRKQPVKQRLSSCRTVGLERHQLCSSALAGTGRQPARAGSSACACTWGCPQPAVASLRQSHQLSSSRAVQEQAAAGQYKSKQQLALAAM